MLLSKFLPSNFDSADKIVLIAGSGDYPRLLWESMLSFNLNVHIIAFSGETEALWLDNIEARDIDIINVGKIGKLLKILVKQRATHVIMAGQIAPRKLFNGLNPDLKALMLLSSLKEKNASTIFGKIISEIEGLGINILDARSFMDAHIAEKGIMCGDAIKVSDIFFNKALYTVKEIANLDIGQGIVVSNSGTIIAVEAFEGTDKMLERAGSICNKPMGFLKTTKAGHDFRFDVPCFGSKTLESMHKSNIKWAALESNKTIMLEKQKLLSFAKKLDITIIGY